jgi:hypothetical protein
MFLSGILRCMETKEMQTGTVRVTVSHHAIQRYRERVDRSASRREAELALGQIVARGRTRPLPRHWLRGHVAPAPGLLFLTWSQRPDVCLLVRCGGVVTVVTRAMCKAEGKRHLAVVRSSRCAESRCRAIRRAEEAWRWDGSVGLDEAA